MVILKYRNLVIQRRSYLESKKIRRRKRTEKIVAMLKNSLPEDVDYRRVEFVGPKVGKELQIIV